MDRDGLSVNGRIRQTPAVDAVAAQTNGTKQLQLLPINLAISTTGRVGKQLEVSTGHL